MEASRLEIPTYALARTHSAETERARSRRPAPFERREFVAQLVASLLFLLVAGSLAVIGTAEPVDLPNLIAMLGLCWLLGTLEFETGPWATVPTQLAVVPMLFVLPPAIVPLVVATAGTLDRVPDVIAGRRHAQRLLAEPGNCWYAIGPALVFVIAGVGAPELSQWPVYVLAFAIHIVFDFTSAALREHFGRGVGFAQLRTGMADMWTADLLLTPIGLLAAFATVVQPFAYLLVVPLAVLLAVFSRDRRARIDHEIELAAAYRGTALLLGDVLDHDDEYTGSHSRGVVAFALEIAAELRVDAVDHRLVEFGALLHDIGKLGVPAELIEKPGPLTDEEWLIMRRHTIFGQQMLDRVGGVLTEVGRVVRASHERPDGTGYPDGIAGESIPLASRIVSVADAYSAMTTRRSYSDALPAQVALAELREHAGTQFDPVVVAAAVRIVEAELSRSRPSARSELAPALP